MGKEKCWSCKKMKNNVRLRASDDRLCAECHDKNEEALRKVRVSDNTGVAGNDLLSCSSACSLCSDQSSADTLRCDICMQNFHAHCVGISDTAVTTLKLIIDVTGWVCGGCRRQSRQTFLYLQSAQAKLVEEVAELKSTVKELEHQISTVREEKSEARQATNNPQKRNIELRCAVHDELLDKNKRSCNIIITGLDQVPGVPDDELFAELCESNLPCKPAIERDQCRRLGRKMEDKTQPLLVTLKNTEFVAEVLKHARDLRKSADENVRSKIYINPDLTVAERKLAYESRVKRRQQRQATLSAPTTLHTDARALLDDHTTDVHVEVPCLSADAVPFQPVRETDSATSVTHGWQPCV